MLLCVNHPSTIQVSGYGWPNALRNAWLIAEGQTLHYDYFRDPLYSVLLNAVVGFTDTYAVAAMVLGWMVAIGTWFFLCRVVQSLAGTGGQWCLLYALTQAPFFHSLMSQVNTYPLSAMSMVMCIWAMIRAATKPSLWRQLCLSLLMGMALCADGRAAVLVPLCVLISWTARGTWGNKMCRVSLCLAIIAAMPNRLDVWCGLETEKLAAHSWGMLLDFQRTVAHRWATVGTDLRMQALCQGLEPNEFLTLSFFSTDCARAVLTHNLTERWPLVLRFPWWQLVCGAGLTAVLCRRSLRLVLMLAALGLWLASMATLLPPRYLIQLGPFALILMVVGLGRVLSWFSVPMQFTVGIGLLVIGLLHRTNGQALISEHHFTTTEWNQILSAIPADIQSVTDCTATGLGVALSPRWPLNHRPERDSERALLNCSEPAPPNSLVIDTHTSDGLDAVWSGFLGKQYSRVRINPENE